MKAFALTLTMAALVCAVIAINVPTTTTPTFSVQHSPTAPWLEVYIDGALDSEWHPRDGEVYRLLLDMIERREGGVLLSARRIKGSQ